MSLAAKHILMLILSGMLAIAGGVTSSAIVIGNVNLVIIGAASSGLFLILQVLVAFILNSVDEKELFLLRRINLKQLERGIAEAEALDSRIEQEIREGNLQGATEWDEFRRRLQ